MIGAMMVYRVFPTPTNMTVAGCVILLSTREECATLLLTLCSCKPIASIPLAWRSWCSPTLFASGRCDPVSISRRTTHFVFLQRTYSCTSSSIVASSETHGAIRFFRRSSFSFQMCLRPSSPRPWDGSTWSASCARSLMMMTPSLPKPLHPDSLTRTIAFATRTTRICTCSFSSLPSTSSSSSYAPRSYDVLPC